MTSTADIKKVLIVGAGTMGQQIGMLFAQFNRQVVIFDLSQLILDDAKLRIQASLNAARNSGAIDNTGIQKILGGISFETDLAKACEHADLVSESVPESTELKGDLFGRLNELCPAHTVFTTNTSTLLPSQFSEQTGRPEKFAALHFHYPTASNRVVDIMPHPTTDPSLVGLLLDLMKEMQMIPIHLTRENSGYVFNAMLTALTGAAIKLVADGVASVEDVDRSWMGVMHTPVGPFGILDAVGITTAYNINAEWARRTQDPAATRHAEFLRPYVDSGKVGTLCGEGFYQYPNPAFAEADFLNNASNDG
ncbi:MAG: 3-hydroxyacyl-CoA dehydrogenase [Halioglobus sp.]